MRSGVFYSISGNTIHCSRIQKYFSWIKCLTDIDGPEAGRPPSANYIRVKHHEVKIFHKTPDIPLIEQEVKKKMSGCLIQ